MHLSLFAAKYLASLQENQDLWRSVGGGRQLNLGRFCFTQGCLLCVAVLRDVSEYRNFMLFAVACMILANQHICTQHPEYVRTLLKPFVCNFADIYGRVNIVYNVHSLVHVVDDAQTFGPLDAFSAFPFESFMQKLKRMVRRPNDPAAQIVGRVKEQEHAMFSEDATSTCQVGITRHHQDCDCRIAKSGLHSFLVDCTWI